MRQCCQWVNTSCHIPLPPGKKYVAVQLLNKSTLYCIVETKERVQHVFKHICSYLGMKSAELFGLALHLDGEHLFLDPNIKLSKLVSKAWKSQSNNGLDSIGRPLLSLHLRIQFFVDCPTLLIGDKQTRHNYYVQLRNNYLHHCQACSEERCFLLAAHALQADLGNYCADRHRGRYFEPTEYFPAWILDRLSEEYVVLNVPCIHKDYKGVSRSEAEMGFIREASSNDAPHNLHVYKLNRKKNDLLGSVWLGVCTRGIEIYENGGINSPTKKLMSTFLWADIRKLCFEKKRFDIVVVSFSEGTRKYTHYTGSDAKSKHLLYLCRSTHQFNLAIQPRLRELRRIESAEDERRRRSSYRESYIYSDTSDLEWEQEHGPLGQDYNCNNKNGYHNVHSTLIKLSSSSSSTSMGGNIVHVVPTSIGDQRTSVISNTSSATTSGIVSDRVLSLDGSEDEMDLTQEPESPQPPDQSVEAINHALLLGMTVGSTVKYSSSTNLTGREPNDNNCDIAIHQPTSSSRELEQPKVVHVNGSSTSSERSTLTVRSCDRLLPNEDIGADLALYSNSVSEDTCSSFDHSYTSSIDDSSIVSSNAIATTLSPPPPPRSSSMATMTTTSDYSDWLIDDNYSDMSSTNSLATSTTTTTGSSYSVNGGLMPLTCAALRNKLTNNRSRNRSNNQPFNNLQQHNYYRQHQHHHHHHHHQFPINRTKIGISSLSRNSTSAPGSKFPMSSALAMAATHHRLTSSGLRLDAAAANWHHHHQMTSISVPNVFASVGDVDDRCLNSCAMSTFPPSCRSVCCFPRRCPSMTIIPNVSNNYSHWSVPNFYVNEMDLLAIDNKRVNGVTHQQQPPPPPYREYPRADQISLIGTTNLMAPSRSYFDLPIKAKSEDNILLQERLGSQLLLNGTGDHRRNGYESTSSSNRPPPPYGVNSPVKAMGLYRSASSVTTGIAPQQQPSREQLLDFQKLRERSRHLGLPLITALCNDQSLMSTTTPTTDPNVIGNGVGVIGVPSNNRNINSIDGRRLSYNYPPPPSRSAGVNSRPISWHVGSGFDTSAGNYVVNSMNGFSSSTPTVNNNYLLRIPSSPVVVAPNLVSSIPATKTTYCKPITLVAHTDAWLHPFNNPIPMTARLNETSLC